MLAVAISCLDPELPGSPGLQEADRGPRPRPDAGPGPPGAVGEQLGGDLEETRTQGQRGQARDGEAHFQVGYCKSLVKLFVDADFYLSDADRREMEHQFASRPSFLLFTHRRIPPVQGLGLWPASQNTAQQGQGKVTEL